ncbi:MAG: choice-of-anchor E domain-containing protein [Opitutaceae bacterium]|nr:choice-of-anchor E domain-containing protein [Verrucomicrobiales bacterium]
MRLHQEFPNRLAAAFTGVVILALSVVLPNNARAAIQTVSGSKAVETTTYLNAPIAVQKFDSALGTLQSVTIRATGTGSFTQFYENTGGSVNNITINQTLNMALAMPVSGSPLNWSQTENHTYSSVPGFDGGFSFSGPSGGTILYSVNASSQTTLSGVDLAQFIGSGLANFLFSASGVSSNSDTTGNSSRGALLQAGADVLVSYDYVAVPEASTWLAGVVALGGLFVGAARRRLLR